MNVLRAFPRQHPTAWRITLSLGVFLLALGFYYFNQRLLTPVSLNAQDVIFGSDTQEIVEALLHPTFENDMRKHVLFSVTLAPIIQFLDTLPLLSALRAMRWVLAALAALNVMGVFLMMLLRNDWPDALLFSGVYALAFANLVMYSIPETYAMSNLVIIVYLLAAYGLRNQLNMRNSLALSALAGLAALYNTPLLALVGIHLLLMRKERPFWQWVGVSLANMAVSVGVVLGVNLAVYGAEIFLFWHGYSGAWASPLNWLNPHYAATVLVDFFVFSIATPVPYLPFALGWQDWPRYWHTPLGALLSLSVPVAVLGGLGVALRKRQAFDLAVLAWVGVMTAFYIYFNPLEAMLYASQILAALVIVLAGAFQQAPWTPRVRRAILLAFVVVLAVHNVPVLWAGLAP